MFYYTCANKKKNKNNCKKKTISKDELEQTVLDMAMELFTTKINLDIICDEIIRVHQKNITEQSVLHLLQNEKAKAEKSLRNIMTAIEEGIINSTTKSRMSELEEQIEQLNAKILAEEYKLQNGITREEVMEYLTHGVRELSPQVLIDVMIHRIELYDDEIVVWFYYSERVNPDNPDADSRDFILQEKYCITVSVKYLIVKMKI